MGGGETLRPHKTNMIYIVQSNKNTRRNDLEYYEEFRSKLGSSKTVTRRLNDIYKQTKNDDLERLRFALIEAHKRHDMAEVERIEKLLAKR